MDASSEIALGPLGSGTKLGRAFYRRPAVECVRSFLGKVLVHETALGRLSGVICDVEAYPAFADGVHHGNKRTPRSEVMWRAGGLAYVYLIYGVWHQFAAVVNDEDVPDVVFVRGVVPVDGLEIMAGQWDKPVVSGALANSPGKLCKSLLITKEQYGVDLCGDQLFLEDWGIEVSAQMIRTGKRVGINTAREGHDAAMRFSVRPAEIVSQLRRVER